MDFDEESTFRLGNRIQRSVQTAWDNYIRGVCSGLTEAFEPRRGLDMSVTSDVPLGAGLSSSAALEVATAGAFRAAWQLDLDDERLALLCQRAENDFVGVQCGAMDQLVSALARADHALLIDCRSLEREHVPLLLDELGVALVVVDSGLPRRLEQSDYNRRREECAGALRLLRAELPDRQLAALCDVAVDDFESSSLPEELLRRVRHVVTEQKRVECAVGALGASDIERFGTLMNESHASLRDDFDVSTPELDRLVELAQVQWGVMGARLTGAGFGGCTVNLVQEEAVDAFAVDVVERYANETAVTARMLVCRAADGLVCIDWNRHGG